MYANEKKHAHSFLVCALENEIIHIIYSNIHYMNKDSAFTPLQQHCIYIFKVKIIHPMSKSVTTIKYDVA